jgi:hypothetical protein
MTRICLVTLFLAGTLITPSLGNEKERKVAMIQFVFEQSKPTTIENGTTYNVFVYLKNTSEQTVHLLNEPAWSRTFHLMVEGADQKPIDPTYLIPAGAVQPPINVEIIELKLNDKFLADSFSVNTNDYSIRESQRGTGWDLESMADKSLSVKCIYAQNQELKERIKTMYGKDISVVEIEGLYPVVFK